MEVLEKSPYAGEMSGDGLFLQALRARGRSLPHLVAPQFGEHIVDVEHVMWKLHGRGLPRERLPPEVHLAESAVVPVRLNELPPERR